MIDNDFFQSAPILENQFDSDGLLRSYLIRKIPTSYYDKIEPDLKQFGNRVISDILDMGRDAEQNPPELIQYDAWGNRIDEIRVSNGWKEMDRVSAIEGLVAIGYERNFQEYSRLYQFAKLYLYTPSSAIHTCPLAMTDAAARVIELLGTEELKLDTLPHLISRDPERSWQSGQWMTEKTGGSDVGGALTTAYRAEENEKNDTYFLNGFKWFTSAATSQMAFTLARIVDKNGITIAGSRGLSLFYLETRNADESFNGIQIEKLKDKLGTKALPTAELKLNNTRATLVGKPGFGVKNIAIMLNITRIYNSISAVSLMRRGLALAKNYALKREAFGKLLVEHPLHVETLAELETEFQACFHFTFFIVELLGKDECNVITPEEQALLRFLTPVVKLYTAKKAIAVLSEVVESFGGAGYLEDTEIPRLFRDSQVLSIWEGTTNVLALDMLRVMAKDPQIIATFNDFVNDQLSIIISTEIDLESIKQQISKSLQDLLAIVHRLSNHGRETSEATARNVAFSIGNIISALLLCQHAAWELNEEDNRASLYVAKRFCSKLLVSKIIPDEKHLQESKAILFKKVKSKR